MNRRDFLIKSARATAAAAVVGGAGFYFHNRESISVAKPLVEAKNFAVAADKSFPAVTLAKSEDHIAALHASLDAIGGIERFVQRGEKVTIKPNIGWDRTAAQGANTSPQLVAEMVRTCLAAGAAEVVVTDISCNDPRNCFVRSGIREAAEKAGAKVYLPADEDLIDVDLRGEVLAVWPVLKYFIETDRLINMPITKQHSLTGCTIGMKNFYGILGGHRSQLHQKIDQSIVDLVTFSKPTLTIVDATRVMMRGGPTGGSLDDLAIHNTVLCGTDPVATDARSSEFLKLDPQRIGYFKLAEKAGLGSIDYKAVGYKEVAV
jgi:uncharacterized protein (DUF362 family)